MDISALEMGQTHSFADLRKAAVPLNIAGVYTVWEGETLIYVGIGGTQVRYSEPNDESALLRPVKGLAGRLQQHGAGDRSGDKFCIYVCDRFVLSTLSRDQILQVAAGLLSLDHMTRDWIRSKYQFRYLETTGGVGQARAVERLVQEGALQAGPPKLNPRTKGPEGQIQS